MIVDVFLYAGELEMAELRRQALAPFVDAQVAVSCDLTYQGATYLPDPPPAGVEALCVAVKPAGRPFGIEHQHRHAIPDALRSAFDWPADTTVLVSDVDEIPDPHTLDAIAAAASRGPVVVPMRMHAFALDYLYPLTWYGTTATTLADCDPQAQRIVQHAAWPAVGAGWHLSWMGTPEQRARKLATFSHVELRGVDVEACRRDAVHVTGQPLRRLTADEMAAMSWPAPLADGGFAIPAEWRAP